MIINLLDGDSADIVFANSCDVIIKGESTKSYQVKWFVEEESDFILIGEMDLVPGTWGSYDYTNISNWKIVFYYEGEQVNEYYHNLENKNVIVIAKFKSTKPGKSFDFNSIKHYCENIVELHRCNLRVYFPGSSRFDFSNLSFSPLRLNDYIENMDFGIEKEF